MATRQGEPDSSLETSRAGTELTYSSGANPGEGEGPSHTFNWQSFLKPDILKLALVLFIPAIVALLVTGRADTIFDFYGYLLNPRMGVWTGTEIVFVFNRFILLWIPFYLAACALVHLRTRNGRAG